MASKSQLFCEHNLPAHLSAIPELDLSTDLIVEPLDAEWFRLAAWTTAPERSPCARNVVLRQSLLLRPADFSRIFDRLDYVGNVIGDQGHPSASTLHNGDNVSYRYLPAHSFEIQFTSTIAEPLVSIHHAERGTTFLINPDLWLYLGLEEGEGASGTWWDVRRGSEALRQRFVENECTLVVEIRTAYLLRYMRARQRALLVGHYRLLQLERPSPAVIAAFEEIDVTIGSKRRRVKALIQSSGPRTSISNRPLLQRRLDLWFMIRPPAIDLSAPWREGPAFDAHAFTLPTRSGDVAPARWKAFPGNHERPYAGGSCDFMSQVFFRQTVLEKYQGSSIYSIDDRGGVRCGSFWGLYRSNRRYGNEYLSTAIGDFAEGVPFEEWPHWKQHAVGPPSRETLAAVASEASIPEAVNDIGEALSELNAAFALLCHAFGVKSKKLWRGSLESLAGRQLKWIYRDDAGDDTFLQRATLASTFVIEELVSDPMRDFLHGVRPKLHLNSESPPRSLGSRNLLQRVALVAILVAVFRPNRDELADLIAQAEGRQRASDDELQRELDAVGTAIRREFEALAFLYDLRKYGGLAHAPNPERAAAAAERLGLSRRGWHRSDYLALLGMIAKSVRAIARRCLAAAPV